MELTREELLAAAGAFAIRDATQTKNERLRQDAVQWLWWMSPGITKRASLP